MPIPPPTHFPAIFHPTDHAHRHRPAEYSPDLRAWVQDGRRVANVKPAYAFIWPKDGKRGSTLGRMKDILSGTGPDIHLSISADKRDHMYNRQRRPRWSNWTNLDDSGPDHSISSKRAPWTQMGILGGRTPGMSYDFRTRKYAMPDRYTWTDAVWQRDADKYTYPEAVRTLRGKWYQDPQWRPFAFNGLEENDIGQNIFV
ncbi:hypothetical protein P153DRAFT_363488 [Dothidotthia symphoricarpi CBS 119687]|uniref:Uncharacterized protein n=1 Tax=Dothidotthia symphoricarpi CBS 119687 TaxID=1392245 RepID=A0A6A6AQN4_9PLEO|nr:uncharacterized protein P153DRAFT_363488 [Dothidotthia symphoricarpi CBS 119687]KAF2133274.1 hypothetical protein P153DRAFT_363488 [Dothidotthia symphoricarpi CBS 119687]